MTGQPTKSKRKRRWFQFGLSTLLLLVTLSAGLLVAWRVYVDAFRRQRETMTVIDELGGTYKTELGAPPWMAQWLGADKFQNVVWVNLADADDPGAYLDEIVDLRHLKTLVVGGKKFEDEQLARLRRIKTLTALVLDSTNVTDHAIALLRRELSDLLVHKSRRRTQFAYEFWFLQYVPWRWSGDTRLRRLVGNEYFVEYDACVDLRDLPITDAELEEIGFLVGTERLEIPSSLATDAGLAHLKGLTELSELNLQDTRITDAGLVHLQGFTNLWRLDLRGTFVTNAGMAHLGGLTNLRDLRLDQGQLSDAGLAHLSGLTRLAELDLQDTSVTDAGLVHLQNLAGLQDLNLRNTRITDAGLVHLRGCTKLESLDLRNTAISDAGLHQLKRLTKLRELGLGGTGVTAAGVEDLQEALPDCTIYWP